MNLETQQYSDIIKELQTAFPGIRIPEPSWIVRWLSQYGFRPLHDAIQTLSSHPAKPRFTTESIGKALSTLLRDEALRRAALTVRP